MHTYQVSTSSNNIATGSKYIKEQLIHALIRCVKVTTTKNLLEV